MAYSTQRVVSDGTLVLLDISINYFERTEIAVLFDGVVDALPWAWVGTEDNQISFTPAVPNLVEVQVVRRTDISEPRHVFTAGAAFTAESLDEDIQQILHIAQEATEGSLGVEFFTDVDMHGYKIKNLAPAVNPTDALQYQQFQDEVQPYVDAASAEADAAAASAVDAAASALAAYTSAEESAASAATSAASAITVVDSGATKAVLKDSNTGAAHLPTGTTAERPLTPQYGDTRVNSTLNQVEWWNNSAWVAVGGGATSAPGNSVFFENDQTVTADYTITTGKHALSKGPISIATGISVTIPDGSEWGIV